MAPSKEIALCTVAELKQKRRVTQWVDELRDEVTVLYLATGEIIVTSSVCLHMGGEFDVDWKTCQFRCQWHDWHFDIRTGESLTYSLPGRHLHHYVFEEKEGKIFVPLEQ